MAHTSPLQLCRRMPLKFTNDADLRINTLCARNGAINPTFTTANTERAQSSGCGYRSYSGRIFMTKMIPVLGLIAAACLPWAAFAAAPGSAQEFVADAIKGDNSEVMLGQLAEHKG